MFGKEDVDKARSPEYDDGMDELFKVACTVAVSSLSESDEVQLKRTEELWDDTYELSEGPDEISVTTEVFLKVCVCESIVKGICFNALVEETTLIDDTDTALELKDCPGTVVESGRIIVLLALKVELLAKTAPESEGTKEVAASLVVRLVSKKVGDVRITSLCAWYDTDADDEGRDPVCLETVCTGERIPLLMNDCEFECVSVVTWRLVLSLSLTSEDKCCWLLWGLLALFVLWSWVEEIRNLLAELLGNFLEFENVVSPEEDLDVVMFIDAVAAACNELEALVACKLDKTELEDLNKELLGDKDAATLWFDNGSLVNNAKLSGSVNPAIENDEASRSDVTLLGTLGAVVVLVVMKDRARVIGSVEPTTGKLEDWSAVSTPDLLCSEFNEEELVRLTENNEKLH